MLLSTPLILFLTSITPSASADTTTPDHASPKPSSLSLLMTKSIISRTQGLFNSSTDRSAILQAGFVQKALHALLTTYRDSTSTPLISAFLTTSIDSIIPAVHNASLSTTAFPLDRLSSGNGLIYQYEKTGEAKYKDAFESLRHSIDLQPRNPKDGLWYYVYPNWSYLDGMYSFAPFTARYTTLHEGRHASAAVEDLILQLDLLWTHCRNSTSGLLVHGYDASRTAVWANNVAGASPHVWGRSLAWYTMALIDTYSLLPKAPAFREARRYVRERFKQVSEAVVRARDESSGAWWQVLAQPGREGNYIESSGSAMFVYAILKGVRVGVLDDRYGSHAGNTMYTEVATQAYEYIRDTFVVDNGDGTLGWNGTVGVCSLNSTASYEYYVSRPIVYNSVLGSAAFVLASLEYEQLAMKNSD